MDTHHNKRSTFSGKLGFVLSAAGASVGLGNIWRFPYLAAKYGGGIFLLVYIILALTFGYTMIMAETGMADPAFLAPDEADRLVFPHVPRKRCQNTAFRRLHIEVQIFHLPPFHGDRDITQHKFFLFHDQSITLILSITG